MGRMKGFLRAMRLRGVARVEWPATRRGAEGWHVETPCPAQTCWFGLARDALMSMNLRA